LQKKRTKSPKKPSRKGDKNKPEREKSSTKNPSTRGHKNKFGREKSPTKKPCTRGDKNNTERENSPTSSRRYGSNGVSPPTNCKLSVKHGKVSMMKLSPEAKRRRRSQYVEPVNLHSAG